MSRFLTARAPVAAVLCNVTQVDPSLVRKRLTKEEYAHRLVGRINVSKAGKLYNEVNQTVLEGGQVDVAKLAAKYEVDPALLAKVLLYTRAPVVRTDMEGVMFGYWVGGTALENAPLEP